MMYFIIALLLACTVGSSKAFLDSLLRDLHLSSNCSISEFQCKNLHQCVPSHVRCDSVNDCGDFSDEADCDFVLCREPIFFRCKNHRCIAKSFVCDKENDCEDYSDEENCEYFKAELLSINTTCSPGEWQCSDKLCIPEEWVCNSEVDCLDGSDEGVGCSIKDEQCDGFRCNNNRCVPREWRCDGHDDCTDNSDELDCEHHFDPKQCTLDHKKYLCLDGKACVDFKEVCDGKYHCFDKSDEGPLCSHSQLNCSNHGCSHDCYQLPTGPKCLCPSGYHNVDEKTCEDINECEEFGICDQKCKNIPGSYECYCEHKYVLQDDKRTCKAIGGEATMIFSSKSQIRSYLLNSNLLFPVASNLKQVVGISSDGYHIYWTDVQSEHESIVRALEDGSNREVIVTSGLNLPEDLEVDWLTGNVYFTDGHMQTIGVCKNDGSHCTVLVNKDIRKPRGIALNVDDGTMYWTDWGNPSEIAFAYMDGSGAKPFLRDDIHWPNGLALDYPNSRLYWTDAKKLTLESIRLDGTGRHVVLKETVKHPFAIAVFENRLYWSDWGTHSIDSCDKFTGKNHHTIIKESKDFIYGISIYHSALHQRLDNPCALAFCSDICLLKGNGYTCACSEGRLLGTDKHICQDVEKKMMLVVAARNTLLSIEHKSLGKHSINALPSVVREAGAVAYNSRNHSLFISDLSNGNIVELNLHSLKVVRTMKGFEKVVSMDYDSTSDNLYICEISKATLEVINLATLAQKVLIHDMDNDVPQSVALVPQEGVMFVSFYDKKADKSHIDRMSMDGSGHTHVAERNLLGPVILHFDAHYHRLFVADQGNGVIEHLSTDGDERHLFKNTQSSLSDITTLDSDLFWINHFSKRLHWADKSSGENPQSLNLDLTDDVEGMHLTSITPGPRTTGACQINNGNCSHLCLTSHKTAVCACPKRMVLAKDNKRCIDRVACDYNEFTCYTSNACVLNSQRCNGKFDCPMGEDEEDCEKKAECPLGYFSCKDGECIPEKQECDHHFDCKDKSDEQHCADKATAHTQRCPPNRFTCADGTCIDERFVCDEVSDCPDNSDENNCLKKTCAASQFRCDSGECIPKSWECDHDYDCKDLSDEHSKCGSVTCSSVMFSCSNGKCVDKSVLCDGSDDCGDRSDESNCFLPVNANNECPSGQFSCTSNRSLCLDNAAKCNGTAECPQGDDEKNCNNCGADAFECLNKKCIPSLWRCDGANDCGDDSDENATLCQAATPTVSNKFLHAPCDRGFRCKSGACITYDLVCNNKQDCFDESDEGGMCATSCDLLNNPCSQQCVRTPSGPMCTCRDGFRLMGDGRTCKDIDECAQDPPVCSQLCDNTEGGFQCDCYSEFSLRGDKRSCKSLGDPLTMIYTIDNQIRQITQKTNSLRVLYTEEMPKITALEVALKEDAVLFAFENSPTIHKMNMNTLKRVYIEHIGYPRKIAYDWATGNVYYYNALSNDKSICVCSFSDMACAKLIDVDVHRHVSELVVDSINRVMFYSLTSWWVFNSPSYVLYRANLDGTGITELIPSTSGFISGLTYDMNKKQLFFADQHQGQLVGTTYEGRRKTQLFGNLTHPSSLKFFEDTLYFASGNGEISKCVLYGTRHCETFKISAHNYGLFTVAQEGLQPKLDDPCANNSCSYMCVTGSSRPKCLCEDGSIVAEKVPCSETTKLSSNSLPAASFHDVKTSTEDNPSGGSATKTVVSVLLISLFIALTGLGLIYYARRKHAGQISVSMRFYNPAFNKNHSDGQEKPILLPGQHEYVNPMSKSPKSDEQAEGFVLDSQNSTALIDV